MYKKRKRKMIIVAIVLLLVLAGTAVCVGSVRKNRGNTDKEQNHVSNGEGTQKEEEPTATPEPTTTPEPTVTSEPTTTPEPTVTSEPTITPEPTATPGSTVTQKPTTTPKPTVTQKPTATPKPPEIIEKDQEACYEEWLAAGMIMAVSMYYTDFELEGIYLASETEVDNALESKGAYIVMKSGGEEYAIYSKPLKAERTEEGTIDLYTLDLGFATFDAVSVDEVKTEKLKRVEMEELSEVIAQSILVSLYEH